MRPWASFDSTRRYRFTLGREWGDGPRVAFIMLNPSTADETKLDPTVRRCLGFAQAWGYGSLEVGNLFALRSTDPRVLRGHVDPIGVGNDEELLGIQDRARLVVCAWGVNGEVNGRGAAVKTMLAARGPLACLGLTKAGHPRHPLYAPRNAAPSTWSQEASP